MESPAADAVAVYTVGADGALSPTYECVLTATSYACSINGVEDFRTLSDPGWVEYPLPEGDVIYLPSHGWWVAQKDGVVPADGAAAQYATGPIPMGHFIEITTGGDGLVGAAMGLLAVVAAAIIAVVVVVLGTYLLWRRPRRAAS